MRVLRCGEAALLIDCDDVEQRRRVAAALQADPPAGVADVVPAALTVGVLLDGSRTLDQVRAGLADLDLDRGVALVEPAPVVTVEVRYDGADLVEVAALLSLTPAELVAWHTGQVWTCDFTGFLPGFGYLVGERPVQVPRRSSPRTRVPAGSVGLAGEYTGTYPQQSPGGWQVIGTTDAPLWRLDRHPPALLVAGARVQFVEVAP